MVGRVHLRSSVSWTFVGNAGMKTKPTTSQPSPARDAMVSAMDGTGGVPSQQLPSAVRRNFRLGVSNGMLFTLGDSLSSAGLVLALLVRQLGGSLSLVGLLPALQN